MKRCLVRMDLGTRAKIKIVAGICALNRFSFAARLVSKITTTDLFLDRNSFLTVYFFASTIALMEDNKLKKVIEWTKEQLQKDVTVSKELHGDRSDVFKVSTPDGDYFLKVGDGLANEYERLLWLKDKLPAPKVIAFESIDGNDILLLSEMKGKNLKVLSKEWAAEKVVTKIAEAIRVFHNVDAAGCPFGVAKDGDVLIHGDASLPNFIFEGDNLSGYIDLGDMAIGNKETDFAAAIWSLQFNLGKGYGKMFLEKYGMRGVTEEGVERLRLKYEDMQDEWGLL